MQALDEELAKVKPGSKKNAGKPKASTASTKSKGKEKMSTIEEDAVDDFDIEAAMEEELRKALEKADEDDDMEGVEGGMDYNLIKNFLESFKSQGGLAGPVGKVAGRLQPGWKVPRDQDM